MSDSVRQILFLVGLSIFLLWCIAKQFYEVAQKKGHYDKKYFWFCFLLCVIGYLLVIALPDRANTTHSANDDLPDL